MYRSALGKARQRGCPPNITDIEDVLVLPGKIWKRDLAVHKISCPWKINCIPILFRSVGQHHERCPLPRGDASKIKLLYCIFLLS